MLRPALAVLSLLSFAATTSAQVAMNLLATVDVSSTANGTNPEYIGNNPIAVAWNGTDLFLAGFNSSGAAGNAAICKISNALTTPTPNAAFGIVTGTPNVRGYIGLDVLGSTLVASYDPGAVSPVGITAWDLNGVSLWAKSGRGGSGVAFDPGFFGLDSGVGWTTFGAGRRFLQNAATGVDIYDATNGMIFNPTPSPGTNWRDMEFDAQTGDIWLRSNNHVVAATRVAGNTLVNQRIVVTPATAANTVVSQNLAFIRQPAGEIVFWNDRAVTQAGQSFAGVVLCNRASDGAPVSVAWGTTLPATGNAAYDFSYDEASKTLAICDFWNRAVYIYQVTVFAPYGAGCAGQGNFTPLLEGSGSAVGNGVLTYTLSQTAPLSVGLFAFGDTQASAPLPFPYFCNVLVAPLILVGGVFVTPPGPSGSGVGSISIPVPVGVSGYNLTAQGFVLENADLAQTVASNGVFIQLL